MFTLYLMLLHPSSYSRPPTRQPLVRSRLTLGSPQVQRLLQRRPFGRLVGVPRGPDGHAAPDAAQHEAAERCRQPHPRAGQLLPAAALPAAAVRAVPRVQAPGQGQTRLPRAAGAAAARGHRLQTLLQKVS